ncbi:hypothetical protein DM02DRAFT_81831 [Periconia macrospinosa]|uniref:Uncharacterized protein n=1 Tax=Periconia macrospinosa TaxID=97972 RepID=A0A2V1DH15_9PLEO|nr:hypothetical protein DM02DRAFT_81831 [Periconia macrospinosa]
MGWLISKVTQAHLAATLRVSLNGKGRCMHTWKFPTTSINHFLSNTQRRYFKGMRKQKSCLLRCASVTIYLLIHSTGSVLMNWDNVHIDFDLTPIFAADGIS